MLTRRSKGRARHRIAAAVAVATAAAVATGPAQAEPSEIRISNWAGYVITGDFHSVSAQWIEPEVVCTDTGVIQRVAPWVGLNGSTVNDATALPLMQTGSEAMCVSDAGMLASMPGSTVENMAAQSTAQPTVFRQLMQVSEGLHTAFGQAVSSGCAAAGTGSAGPRSACAQGVERTLWREAYPAAPVRYDDVTSAPGDSMSATVTRDGNAYTMTLSNLTKHWTRTTVETSDAPALTAEIVIEGQFNNALPSFTPITFTNIEVDGQPLTAYAPMSYSIAASNGVLTPGPISPDGTAFTLAR
ncbi:G1 family glutamic endopeptidase [Nocardia sp. GCM10030253]|uniref:G1 family glutamic endopeptidase n=1 Tax=Nocardia sp. GCM10030253 TaxID=3273404 RepID=UPI003625EF63